MSTEDIRHVYCDGDDCCESIDGYNPNAKNVDERMVKSLKEKGWLVIEEDDVVGGFFCGFPITIEYGETKHFCPKCKGVMVKSNL